MASAVRCAIRGTSSRLPLNRLLACGTSRRPGTSKSRTSSVMPVPEVLMPPFTSACAPIAAQPTKSISPAVMPEVSGFSTKVFGSISLK